MSFPVCLKRIIKNHQHRHTARIGKPSERWFLSCWTERISVKTRQTPKSIGFLITAILLILSQSARAQENDAARALPPEKTAPLTLVRALMCEGMKEFEPEKETIVFSATLGQAVCFTAFDPVPEKTEIYHNWFRKDQPDAKFKLTLKPPKWASFSKIRLRNSDTGPWRVDITDGHGRIFQTLRFSVTE
jgi:hypothetical protein